MILSFMVSATFGKVAVEGRDVTTVSEGERDQLRGSLFGIVLQFPRLFHDVTALRNVEIAAIDRNPQRWRDLLGSVGLSALANTRAGVLSGGEQQRLSLARALVNDPVVVVADEPSSGLDDENAGHLVGLFWIGLSPSG
ncbi:MAG: ATP-binding cassette domain-containing protein [Propioniciclava sp.]